jgi:hypothetical protein
MHVIPIVADKLLASEEGPYSMKLVNYGCMICLEYEPVNYGCMICLEYEPIACHEIDVLTVVSKVWSFKM